jgi:hypothetical protein
MSTKLSNAAQVSRSRASLGVPPPGALQDGPDGRVSWTIQPRASQLLRAA